MTDRVPRRWLLPAVGVAAVFVVGVPLWLLATAGTTGGGMSGGHMMGGGMAGGAAWTVPAAFLWTVATLVLVAGGAALALSPSDGTAEADAEDPVETLRERYVVGELSEAEFERRLETLLASEDVEGVTEADVERERART